MAAPAVSLMLGAGVVAPAMAAPAHNAAAPAVALASQYKGIPYVWGGTTTRGFDCSGYVQFIFRKLGVTLPRTAEAQWAAAEHITRGQLRPGDLVFWGRPYGVYHVGIYAGHDKVWNAPHTGARVHLETIWGGAKLYGRVRGITSPVDPSASAAPTATGLGPVGNLSGVDAPSYAWAASPTTTAAGTTAAGTTAAGTPAAGTSESATATATTTTPAATTADPAPPATATPSDTPAPSTTLTPATPTTPQPTS